LPVLGGETIEFTSPPGVVNPQSVRVSALRCAARPITPAARLLTLLNRPASMTRPRFWAAISSTSGSPRLTGETQNHG
jgi:hypothetical protein